MFDVVHKNMKLLEPLLQKNVMFNVEHKTLRKGRLMLYNVNDYHIKFTIRTNKDVLKTYEIPFPFAISSTDTHAILSYQIHELCMGNQHKQQMIRQFEPLQNKLYDKELYIVNMDMD